MAGKNETPRQKMIGLMYLVLTALLALQVNSTVLDKFSHIDDNLQNSASISRKDNDRLLQLIRKGVLDRGNKAEDQILVKNAMSVIEETDKVIEKIESMRNEIISITGGVNDDGQYKGAAETEKIANFALGGGDSKNGEAYELKSLLDQYVANMNKLYPDLNLPRLALDASEIDLYKNSDHKNKDFAQLNFEDTPMVAALAVLSEMKNEVMKVEEKALDKIRDQIGVEEISLDRLVAKVSAESRVVPAGAPYRAKMYIAASSSVAEPEVEANIGKVSVNNDGEGELEFIASANNFDENGLAKKVWKGKIRLQTPQGEQVFEVEEEYLVRKPALQFRSAAVQVLYRNCGNELNVQVPELGANYNPSFSARGGEIRTSGTPGLITAIPKQNNMVISVKNDGYAIGQEKFRVRSVPLPTVKLFDGNRPLDFKNGKGLPRRLNVKVIPDSDFAAFLPRDAKYRVTDWTITLASGTTQKKDPIKPRGQSADLSNLRQAARPGTRLVIEINKVQRINFENQREDVDIEPIIVNYVIN
ncbi:MAG: gliding motility protein GldM [Bacteroidota bacterium]